MCTRNLLDIDWKTGASHAETRIRNSIINYDNYLLFDKLICCSITKIIFPITFICIIGLRSITYSFRSIHSSKKYLLTRIYEQKLEFMRAFTIIRDLRRIECGKIWKLFVKQLFSRNVSQEKEKNFHGFEGIHLGTKTRATFRHIRIDLGKHFLARSLLSVSWQHSAQL